jgi:hypothetical protein
VRHLRINDGVFVISQTLAEPLFMTERPASKKARKSKAPPLAGLLLAKVLWPLTLRPPGRLRLWI